MSETHISYVGAEAVELSDGRVFRGPSCESSAARALLSDGLAPDAKLIFMRDGRPSLTGGVIAFAGRMWAGEARDPAHRPYRPRPRRNANSSATAAAQNGVPTIEAGHPTTDTENASGAGGAV